MSTYPAEAHSTVSKLPPVVTVKTVTDHFFWLVKKKSLKFTLLCNTSYNILCQNLESVIN